MRVIIIADHAIAEGGAPQVAIASACGLAAAGHEVVYIHGVGDKADAMLEAQPGIRRIGLGGKDVWSKPLPVAARDGIWNREHQARLQALLAGMADGNTVVHVHQWTKFFSPSVFATIRAAGLPLVTTLHDYFLSCPTGLMYQFDQQAPCALRPLSAGCLMARCDPRSSLHKAVRVLRAVATKRVLGAAPFTAIHVSEIGQRTIGAFLPGQARQVVLENPIECEDRGVRQAGPDLRVTYCGRLTEEKGAVLVAEAAKAAGLPSLFIGEGPMAARIRAIDPQAVITGWLDKPAVRARIAQEALVVVAPSRWPETGPLVIAEAMAAGVPVIASDRAGAAGRIVPGLNGFVVPPEREALATALRHLVEPGVAARMGAEGYARFWADPPSLQAHSGRLAQIYAEALARHAAQAQR